MESRYISFPIDSLQVDTSVDFDIYLTVKSKIILYREANLPFDEKTKQKLSDSKIKEFLIENCDKKKFFSYVEDNINQIMSDKKIPNEVKSKFIYETSKTVVIDLFEKPESSKNLKRSLNILSSSLGFILSEKSSLYYLLRVASADYSTYTHSINVAIYAISLANSLKMFNKSDIVELGWGAMLHDVGKSKVPKEILEKKDNLTKEEYDQIKKHPAYGVSTLKKMDVLPEKAYLPVAEHQEKGDGSGYPKGLKLKEISDFGRITAICDVFDALTTNKPYRAGVSTIGAIKIMSNLKGHFDPTFLKTFILLMAQNK